MHCAKVSHMHHAQEHIGFIESRAHAVMSEVFAMNPTYFSSFFHQKTGMKYKDYLTRARMTEAKRLLLQTDLKIYEISQMVGFSDVRYFSQTFAKASGVLPKDYRSRK